MDGLRKWELEWLRERFPLRWKEVVSRLIFPGEPVSDLPDRINVTINVELDVTLAFKLESREVEFLLTTGSDRMGILEPKDKSWSLDLGDVREVDAEGLADLIVDSYDVVVVMGS